MAVWPVSHCLTLSHREDYVTELSRYIDVDIYGACGKRKCNKNNQTSCMKQWERKYMFYLSFENCLCEDYITEKTFRPLNYEIIPVVLGGGNYSRDIPPHSVINAKDFNSPKDLADFLINLAADEQRYRSYFKWKTHYRIIGGVQQFLCR
jgi:alpha-1,3-fucosyltransferase